MENYLQSIPNTYVKAIKSKIPKLKFINHEKKIYRFI